jgi:hypothetical protein
MASTSLGLHCSRVSPQLEASNLIHETKHCYAMKPVPRANKVRRIKRWLDIAQWGMFRSDMLSASPALVRERQTFTCGKRNAPQRNCGVAAQLAGRVLEIMRGGQADIP